MDNYLLWIAIAEGVVIVGLAIALICICVGKKAPKAKAEDVTIIDGVRYTKNKMEWDESGNAKVTHKEKDVILEKGVTYTAKKDSAMLPGKYIVLTSVEGVNEFNMRIGGLVRPVKHGSDIIIADGEEITSVSHTVVLR